MLHKLLLIITLLFTTIVNAQKNMVTISELQPVLGAWQGKLTYLDYTSGKPFSMPANVHVAASGNNILLLEKTYPKEPQANETDTIIISANGKKFDNEKIIAKKTVNGVLEFSTSVAGKDGNDNKPATIKHTYIISTSLFIIRKEVQFTGTTQWILRNEYRFDR